MKKPVLVLLVIMLILAVSIFSLIQVYNTNENKKILYLEKVRKDSLIKEYGFSYCENDTDCILRMNENVSCRFCDDCKIYSFESPEVIAINKSFNFTCPPKPEGMGCYLCIGSIILPGYYPERIKCKNNQCIKVNPEKYCEQDSDCVSFSPNCCGSGCRGPGQNMAINKDYKQIKEDENQKECLRISEEGGIFLCDYYQPDISCYAKPTCSNYTCELKNRENETYCETQPNKEACYLAFAMSSKNISICDKISQAYPDNPSAADDAEICKYNIDPKQSKYYYNPYTKNIPNYVLSKDNENKVDVGSNLTISNITAYTGSDQVIIAWTSSDVLIKEYEDMDKNEDGTYNVTITAPEIPGSYQLTLIEYPNRTIARTTFNLTVIGKVDNKEKALEVAKKAISLEIEKKIEMANVVNFTSQEARLLDGKWYVNLTVDYSFGCCSPCSPGGACAAVCASCGTKTAEGYYVLSYIDGIIEEENIKEVACKGSGAWFRDMNGDTLCSIDWNNLN